MLTKCQNLLYKSFFTILLIGLAAWKPVSPDLPASKYIQQCLERSFDASAEGSKLKKWELEVTDEGFFRFRKYLPNGKQEYFAFNLKRFQVMDFLGTSEKGTLLLQTKGEDIIVQTYNDPKGNIDSMAGVLKIPLKNIEADELNQLYIHLAQSLK